MLRSKYQTSQENTWSVFVNHLICPYVLTVIIIHTELELINKDRTLKTCAVETLQLLTLDAL